MCNLEDEKTRCEWVTSDPIYVSYHDTEWGKPQHDNIQLFEMLCLEGQQAGLSWLTILKKRDNYRDIFFNFNPYKISKLNSANIAEISCNPGIVRHRGKIEAIIQNAKCYILLENKGESFSEFIWKFVDDSPIINSWKNSKEVPTESIHSIALSKSLKKVGFKYVGPTTCYAFMQACGLVNDHVDNCFLKTVVV